MNDRHTFWIFVGGFVLAVLVGWLMGYLFGLDLRR